MLQKGTRCCAARSYGPWGSAVPKGTEPKHGQHVGSSKERPGAAGHCVRAASNYSSQTEQALPFGSPKLSRSSGVAQPHAAPCAAGGEQQRCGFCAPASFSSAWWWKGKKNRGLRERRWKCGVALQSEATCELWWEKGRGLLHSVFAVH